MARMSNASKIAIAVGAGGALMVGLLLLKKKASPSGATTDAIGGTSASGFLDPKYVHANPITASSSRALSSLGVNVAKAVGNIALALYADDNGVPGVLIGQTTYVPASAGWNDVPIGPTSVDAGKQYWIAIQGDSPDLTVYYSAGPTQQNWYYYGVGVPFQNNFISNWQYNPGLSSEAIYNMRMI